MPFPHLNGSSLDAATFLQLVLDHVSDCLVAVDTEGLVVLINAPYCKLLGGTPGDFIGRHITEVVSPQTHLHRVARGEEVAATVPLEVRGCKLIARQVPVFEEGEIVGAVGLALFSNYELLKKTYSMAFNSSIALQNSRPGWNAQYRMADILGAGPEMETLRSELALAARHTLPVLIEGETGTGKELAAQAVHTASDRAQGPFVWINCASIPEQLIDAELFGYEAGAFTGASSRGKPGKFELAAGGTIFLDEIGDMPLALQASLLRALQSQSIVRVGGTAPIAVDARVLAATNRRLSEDVRQGTFREDLYYRLAMFTVSMPPLRERTDLRLFIEQLLAKLAAQHGLPLRKLPSAQLAALAEYPWPGNVRQLEGVLLRLLLTGKTSLPEVTDDLTSRHSSPRREEPGDLNLGERLAQEKKRLIKEALAHCGDDRTRAAKLLGISRASLYRELQPGTPS
ncbi:transcriptional regulator with PAS, ATPase and Fis domain [Paraburkholderia terricola]|uniref:sigma-54 interaction domain-containing protein n=1 Tax=Paraburkholderia terricola TaxID=169427 RepID=UPI00285510FF|nr:sigma 54-interacting transcriptional regulator [Paraburkholderia terricola]MDR6495682.1 transcriptional regulator with PAS, ATPase and Fis domain [Paraburkholderia terricola]